MTGELITKDSIGALIAAQGEGAYSDSTALADVSKAGDYLPYIQLMGSNSLEVKRGQFPQGHFALRSGKMITDLGTEFVCMVLKARPKAMRFKPKVEAFYDPKSSDFKDVRLVADTQKNAGCAYGPEFLLWLPAEKMFVLYFLGNKTGRNEAANVLAVMNGKRVCIQKSHLIESADYAWHGPQTQPYDLDIELPSGQALIEQLSKFNNPPVKEEIDDAEPARD